LGSQVKFLKSERKGGSTFKREREAKRELIAIKKKSQRANRERVMISTLGS